MANVNNTISGAGNIGNNSGGTDLIGGTSTSVKTGVIHGFNNALLDGTRGSEYSRCHTLSGKGTVTMANLSLNSGRWHTDQQADDPGRENHRGMII
jgi:hypothetical protein